MKNILWILGGIAIGIGLGMCGISVVKDPAIAILLSILWFCIVNIKDIVKSIR